MIFDSLSHADRYTPAHPLSNEAWRFLRRSDLSSLTAGRYELAEGAYASVQEYTTVPLEHCSFESHRNFVDVQFLLAGEEWIYVASPDTLSLTRDYDEQSDCAYYQGAPETRALMRPGHFLVLFPHDAHMPTVSVNGPTLVKKVVVKLPV